MFMHDDKRETSWDAKKAQRTSWRYFNIQTCSDPQLGAQHAESHDYVRQSRGPCMSLSFSNSEFRPSSSISSIHIHSFASRHSIQAQRQCTRSSGKMMRKPLTLIDTRSCPRECLEMSVYPRPGADFPCLLSCSRQRNLESSAFLRLPAELRNRIYEEVLANKTIHIGHYACPPYKTGAVRFATFYRRDLDNHFDSFGDEKPLPDSYLKLSHAICEAQESESSVHDRCKTCTVQDGCQWNSPARYDSRHEACLGTLQDFDALWLIPSLDDFRDSTCQEVREEYSQNYERLRQTNMGSQLHLDILRVCRQTHKEAGLLPYQLNTFAFTCGFTMDRFISENLIAAQKEAI